MAHPPARPSLRRPEHVQLLVLGDTPLFFSTRDGGWFPTLRASDVPLGLPCFVGCWAWLLSMHLDVRAAHKVKLTSRI